MTFLGITGLRALAPCLYECRFSAPLASDSSGLSYLLNKNVIIAVAVAPCMGRQPLRPKDTGARANRTEATVSFLSCLRSDLVMATGPMGTLSAPLQKLSFVGA